MSDVNRHSIELRNQYKVMQIDEDDTTSVSDVSIDERHICETHERHVSHVRHQVPGPSPESRATLNTSNIIRESILKATSLN
ncbi:hypothetical protein J6590_101863, partial [Homalodisca vitripennis]